MTKQTRLSYFFFFLALVSSLLHNLISGFFGIEEPVFFSLFLFFSAAFLISLVFNIFNYKKKGQPKDLWKLGWLGLLGLIGFLPRFGPGFYGFYGLFGFFGLKKNQKTG
jgi:hypothetical protein